MKKLIIFLILILAPILAFATNDRDSGPGYEFATVDTDPGSAGFYTGVIVPLEGNKDRTSFFVMGSGTMTVTLQYRVIYGSSRSAWIDYDTYSDNTRVTIDDTSRHVEWRAGVKSSSDYTSGEKKFGFDW